MKTSELIGPALDWAVAKCEGLDFEIDARPPHYPSIMLASKNVWGERRCIFDEEDGGIWFRPTTDWSQAGPIIDRERIHVAPQHPSKGGWMAVWEKEDTEYPTKYGFVSPSPLIAAMRAYVASRLGDEVEIPEELLPC